MAKTPKLKSNNRFSKGNPVGRPPFYKNVRQFEKKCDEYFESCTPEVTAIGVSENRPTITGLALFLGFNSKGTLYEYAKRDEFASSVKRALTVVESYYEEKLSSPGSNGAQFALKNFGGWHDKQEIEQTNKGETVIKVVYEDGKTPTQE